ncbi:MAG: hypothetical protein BWK73_41060, partial [Thiothrix lacustris]
MHKKLLLSSWQLVGAGILLLSSTAVLADISGKAFRDFNANGTFDTGASFNEVGAAGVTVKAFAAADPASTPSATATSGADGTYTLTGLTGGADYRLEYSWAESWLKPGAADGTSVQFVKDGAMLILPSITQRITAKQIRRWLLHFISMATLMRVARQVPLRHGCWWITPAVEIIPVLARPWRRLPKQVPCGEKRTSVQLRRYSVPPSCAAIRGWARSARQLLQVE